MDLTDNDRQRIEQEADVFRYDSIGFRAFKKGAEYATRYEREQQVKLDQKHIELLQGRCFGHLASGAIKGVLVREDVNNLVVESMRHARANAKIEAERTELRNKVIEEVIEIVSRYCEDGNNVFVELNSLKK